jgi:hypothetical protein
VALGRNRLKIGVSTNSSRSSPRIVPVSCSNEPLGSFLTILSTSSTLRTKIRGSARRTASAQIYHGLSPWTGDASPATRHPGSRRSSSAPPAWALWRPVANRTSRPLIGTGRPSRVAPIELRERPMTTQANLFGAPNVYGDLQPLARRSGGRRDFVALCVICELLLSICYGGTWQGGFVGRQREFLVFRCFF